MSELKELAKELCDKSGCHHKCHDTKDCVVEDEAELLISNKLRCIDCIHNEICQFYNALGTKVICYPCGFYEAKEVIANSATTKEKQIEVLKGDICIAADYCYGACDECNLGDLAESLYNAGYRKQSEDTVEVVRCKYCEYYNENEFTYSDDGYGRCNHPQQAYDCECFDMWVETTPDDYCSYGKMKDGEKQ